MNTEIFTKEHVSNLKNEAPQNIGVKHKRSKEHLFLRAQDIAEYFEYNNKNTTQKNIVEYYNKFYNGEYDNTELKNIKEYLKNIIAAHNVKF